MRIGFRAIHLELSPQFLRESSELWPKDFVFRNEIPGLAAKEFKRGSPAVCETNVNLAVIEPNVEQ